MTASGASAAEGRSPKTTESSPAGVGEARPAEPPQAEESLGSAAESAAQEYRVVYPGGSSTTGFTDEDEAVAWSQGFAGARVEWRTPWTALEEAR